MTLQDTPTANRTHIGFFGKRNSGKSSLINALTGQKVTIVSNVAGTTTDPVYKPMEIHGLGACVLIDTAGFDDIGELGQLRIEKTKLAAEKTDIAVILFAEKEVTEELKWYDYFQKKKIKVICVISKSDVNEATKELEEIIKEKTKEIPLHMNTKDSFLVNELKQALIQNAPNRESRRSITSDLVQENDVVLLVMPQDIQAPEGRLILPQVQTIRDLLDKKCIVVSITTDQIESALNALVTPPKLIITDSQAFETVYKKKPKESKLTSFSILFAAYKGDIEYYSASVAVIDTLTESSKVLIAECCTHAPLTEDIGREKLPRMLKHKVGEGLTVEVVSGTDFPTDVTPYQLIIQCGACMFNRTYVMTRINQAKQQGVPMTNYGVALAHLTGILNKLTPLQ